VESDADAEKLRKGLRDIQHQYLVSLHKVLQKGHYDLLVHLLNLDECSIKYSFQGVDSESLNYDKIVASERSEKQSLNRTSSSIRVAVTSLNDYTTQDESRRWAQQTTSEGIKCAWSEFVDTLDDDLNKGFNEEMDSAFESENNGIIEQSIKTIVIEYGVEPPEEPRIQAHKFDDYMKTVAEAVARENFE
jgi:hypothetical protein